MNNDVTTTKRIAVLIDCDNVSAKHVGAALEELAVHGVPTVKRGYGDWTTPHLSGWKNSLVRHAIQPMQQFANTAGKNSTDSALIIDAMDLLWQGNVDAFAIMSSDSDFTRLATRLRESGKEVFGFGERKTPDSLRLAVDRFTVLEVLNEEDQDSREPIAATTVDTPMANPADSASTINLQSALTKAINATSDEEGWSMVSQVGQQLRRAHPDFDPRTFGHPKLTALIEQEPYLETQGTGSVGQVRRRGKQSPTPATATAKKSTRAAANSVKKGKEAGK